MELIRFQKLQTQKQGILEKRKTEKSKLKEAYQHIFYSNKFSIKFSFAQSRKGNTNIGNQKQEDENKLMIKYEAQMTSL